jgi:hypothetical protein
MPRVAVIAVLVLAPLAAGAQEQRPPLGEVPEIAEGLIATAIAYEVGRVCGPVDGRRVQGLAYLLQLQGRARELGYSQEEINAFIDGDDPERARLEGVARSRLAALGAVEGDEESHCAVGRAEIAKGSQIGRLLTE